VSVAMTICCWHWICDNDHRLLELEDDKDATETLSIRTSRLMRIWTMIIDLLLVLLEKKRFFVAIGSVVASIHGRI